MAGLNITKRGKYWQYRFDGATIGGKRQQISKSGFRTKKDAETAGHEKMAEYNQSGLKFTPTEISVSDYLDYWFKHYVMVNLRSNTQYGYTSIIENHLKKAFGQYKLKSLTPAVLQEYLNNLTTLGGYCKSTITGIMSVMAASLDYAVHPLKFINDNPCRYLRSPNEEKLREGKERVILTDEEFQSIIDEFPEGSRYFPMLMIGWYAGLRIGECCALTWDDIDFENNIIDINKQVIRKSLAGDITKTLKKRGKKEPYANWTIQVPKTSTGVRKIRMGAKLREILLREKERQEENEEKFGEYYTIHVLKDNRIIPVYKGINSQYERIRLICIDVDGQYTTSDSFKYPSRIVHHKLKLAFDYHSLRHTHATKLIEAGVSPKVVQTRLGHKHIETTLQTYVHCTPEMEDDAVDIFDGCTQVKSTCTKCVQKLKLVNK